MLCCFSNRQICKLQPDFVTEIHHIVLHRTILPFKTHTVQFEKSLEELRICNTVSAVRQHSRIYLQLMVTFTSVVNLKL